MNHINVSKTCPNCLQETKVVLVDLNLYNKKEELNLNDAKERLKKIFV